MESMIKTLKLINGDEIIAEDLGLDKDEKHHIIYMPMKTEEVHHNDGTVNVILSRYLQYSDVPYMAIKKEHVITISTIYKEFMDYYVNCIKFNEKFTEPSMLSKIRETNNSMNSILDGDNEKFNKLLNDKLRKNPANIVLSKMVQ